MTETQRDSHLPGQGADGRRTRRGGATTPANGAAADAYRAARRHSVFVKSLRYRAAGAGAGRARRLLVGDRASSPSDLPAPVSIVRRRHRHARASPWRSRTCRASTGTRRAYDVTADTAVQSLDDPKIITLSGIVGHFALDDGERCDGQGGRRRLRRAQQFPELTDGIVATTTQRLQGEAHRGRGRRRAVASSSPTSRSC